MHSNGLINRQRCPANGVDRSIEFEPLGDLVRNRLTGSYRNDLRIMYPVGIIINARFPA
jgi:hypothetical protein